MALSMKRKKFCEQYCKNGGNGAQAVLSSYPNCKDAIVAKAMANQILNNEEVKSYIEEKQMKLEQRFEKESVKAFETILAIIDDKRTSARIKLDACKDILDRAGYKPKDTVEISGSIEHETRYTREIASRARLLLDHEVIETIPEPSLPDNEIQDK